MHGLFELFDSNGDGVITRNELADLMTALNNGAAPTPDSESRLKTTWPSSVRPPMSELAPGPPFSHSTVGSFAGSPSDSCR